MDLLESEVAIVSGAASGIGRAMALRLAAGGTRVIACDIHAKRNEVLRQELDAISTGHHILDVDVSDRDAVHRICDRTGALSDKTDFLFCNAGVGGQWGAFSSSPQPDWQWCLKTNVLGIVHMLEAFVPAMACREQDNAVVITASIAGLLPGPGMGAYSPSKYAAVAIAEGLAQELADTRTTVSVLCPGFVDTDFLNSARHLKSAPSHHSDNDALKKRRAKVAAQMASSTSSETVVEEVFAALLQKRPYILSHPEFGPALEKRFAGILACVRPSDI